MNTEIELLKERVEMTFGRRATSARHFEELRESIFARCGVLMSATTLKRLWGYLDEGVTPRLHTLDTLSRYAGWKGWQEFVASPEAAVQSGPVGRPSIDVESLKVGETVVLSWLPDRECEVRYLGRGRFEIISAKNTRLQSGDTFQCQLIIQDEPLYLDHLRRDGADLGVYVCGRHSGVKYARKHAAPPPPTPLAAT